MMYITLPNGKPCSLGVYVKGWKAIKTMAPHETVRGWTWWAEDACRVLDDIARGVHDRINRHDRTMRHDDLGERRLFTKIRNAAKRGAIRYECKWCGSPLDPLQVNPNNGMTRYCPGCRP